MRLRREPPLLSYTEQNRVGLQTLDTITGRAARGPLAVQLTASDPYGL